MIVISLGFSSGCVCQIYPPAIQGLADKESIQDKWELAIRCINGMQSVIDGMRSKTL